MNHILSKEKHKEIKQKKKEKSQQKSRLAERQNRTESAEPRPSSSGLGRSSRAEKESDKTPRKKAETRKHLQLQPHTMNFRNVDTFLQPLGFSLCQYAVNLKVDYTFQLVKANSWKFTIKARNLQNDCARCATTSSHLTSINHI